MKINIHQRNATGISASAELATVVNAQTVSLKDISREIEEQVGIPMIRSMSVLDAFATIVTKHLKEGNNVEIDSLLRLRSSVTVKGSKPSVSKIICVAAKSLRTELDSIDFIINNR